MHNYNACVDANLLNIDELKIRTLNTEFKWSEFAFKLKTRNIEEISPDWNSNQTNIVTKTIITGYLIFAEDADIYF